MREVSVSTVVLDGFDMLDAVRLLAGMGATLVEPAFIAGYVAFGEEDLLPPQAARLRSEAERSGVAMPTVSAHCDLGAPDASELLDRRISFASELGSRILISNASRQPLALKVRRTIEEALPRLERLGLVLALENPGHGYEEITGKAEDLAAFVRSFGSPFLRANLDLCNIHTYSLGQADAGAALAACADVIASLHLKEVREAGDGWQFCALGAPGAEAIDAALISSLEALSPGVAVALELPIRLSRPHRHAPVRAPIPPSVQEVEAAIAKSLDTIASPRP